MGPVGWPTDAAELAALQQRLAAARPTGWQPAGAAAVGASCVCFARGDGPPGGAGEPAWAAAARKQPGSQATVAVIHGVTAVPYRAGFLALREGGLRQRALEALEATPDVVIVDATGRDHPRRAGLALHLGAVLDVPTVGATDRPLMAVGEEPGDDRGATAPLRLDGELVGFVCRTRAGTRPVYVSAGWRTTPDVAAEVVVRAANRARTPQPLREARRAARAARGRAGA